MDASERESFEQEVRGLTEAEKHNEAVSRLIEGYGPEILSYLLSNMGNEDEATQAYSDFCVNALKGLPRFRWQSSLRTWSYRIAARCRADFYRFRHRRKAYDHVGLSQSPAIGEVAERVRTQTLQYVKTSVKDRFSDLRDKLKPEDRDLLVLHVNRKLTFNEIAEIQWEGEEEMTEEDLKRGAARLRARFHRLKGKLRELARKEGLIGG